MLQSDFVVLGGGSAGLIAAITLKRAVPEVTVRVVRSPEIGIIGVGTTRTVTSGTARLSVTVRVVRSPEIGIIGVGEGTTPFFPQHLHDFLGLSTKEFFHRAQPTWKLGLRLLWGARGDFNYTFDSHIGWRWRDLRRNNGFYCDDDMSDAGLFSALMKRNKVFPVGPDGNPEVTFT